MSSPHVTVTRKGDQFTYRHKADNASTTTTSLGSILDAASSLIEVNEKTTAALGFLENALNMHAGNGHGLDEHQVCGVAALCGALSNSMAREWEARFIEVQIITNATEAGVAHV